MCNYGVKNDWIRGEEDEVRYYWDMAEWGQLQAHSMYKLA
jgi:hypothetical protein